MKQVKLIVVLVLLTLTNTTVHAQSNRVLIGKWKAAYNEDGEKAFITYEIKMNDGELNGYSQYIEDDRGNGENYNGLVLEDIRFSNDKGKATYLMIYEGEPYTTKATLTLIDANTLKIQYSHTGYSDSETWKRVK